MMRAYYTYRALKGLDESCLEYIKAQESFSAVTNRVAESKATKNSDAISSLATAIERGMKGRAEDKVRELLISKSPLDIIDEEIIPALNRVGEAFECGKAFLPELLMSAEAARCAAEVIKEALKKVNAGAQKATFVLATVKGDIHDIGKNIVKLLLENYGYNVIDLGRDVEPEAVLEAVIKNKAPLVGLSALMTTTLPAMKATVELIKKEAPFAKVIVGGAVLTEEYARVIGADAYGADAMATVRFAEGAI
jgi:5-methyltetrahydrofolate--homocysteine methyltransferase